MNKTIVAVYGTLRIGQHANGKLATAKYLGTGHTTDLYCMIDYGFPMLVQKGRLEGVHPFGKVMVDVYEIDANTAHELDMYEGYPTLYVKHETEVELEAGVIVPVTIYVGGEDDVGILNNTRTDTWSLRQEQTLLLPNKVIGDTRVFDWPACTEQRQAASA